MEGIHARMGVVTTAADPAFLAPGTCFLEDSFPRAWEQGDD